MLQLDGRDCMACHLLIHVAHLEEKPVTVRTFCLVVNFVTGTCDFILLMITTDINPVNCYSTLPLAPATVFSVSSRVL